MALFKTAVIHTDTGYCGLCWQVWRDRKEKNPSAPPPSGTPTRARAERTTYPTAPQLALQSYSLTQSYSLSHSPQSHSLSLSPTACPTVIQLVPQSYSLSQSPTACPTIIQLVPQFVTRSHSLSQSHSLSHSPAACPSLAPCGHVWRRPSSAISCPAGRRDQSGKFSESMDFVYKRLPCFLSLVSLAVANGTGTQACCP